MRLSTYNRYPCHKYGAASDHTVRLLMVLHPHLLNGGVIEEDEKNVTGVYWMYSYGVLHIRYQESYEVAVSTHVQA